MSVRATLIALGCGLLAAGCGSSSGLQVANSGVTTPVTTPSGAPRVEGLDAIAFSDVSHGWAGGRGAIIATSDGGASWKLQYSGGATISSFDVLDGRHGWAVATNALLRTEDGGGWSEAGEPAGMVLTSVEFTSPDQGWGVALPSGQVGAPVLGALVRSDDGGASWAVVKQNAANTICVSGDSLVAGAGGKVLRSTDGGATWSTLLDKGDNPITSWFTAAVQCPDPSSIWVLFTGGVAAGSEGYAAYASGDAGVGWQPVVVSPILVGSVPELKDVTPLDSYAGPFDAVTGSDAVFTGQCPACDPQRVTVLATQDGGSSWDRHEVPGFYPTGVSFADADHGWMTTLIGGTQGRRSAILATSDGGRSWKPVYPS